VIIGHEEEAAKAALLLAARYHPSKLTLLTNGKKGSFSQETLHLLQEKQIHIAEQPIEKILGAKKGVLKGFELSSSKKIDADIGFVYLGVRPNNALALQLKAEIDNKGLVVTDEQGESSIPNMFVIGDLRSGSMKQIYTAWQHAVDVVQVIDRRIRAEQ
jgi:thioredoxin reductase (NADPH)